MSIQLSDKVSKYIETTRPFLIDGKWLTSDEIITVKNPANGQEIGSIYAAGKEEVDLAVKAARRAFESKEWRRMAPTERTAILWKFADLIEENHDEILELEILNEGLPIAIGKHFIVHGLAETIRYYAGWCTKIGGHTTDLSLPDERGPDAVGPAFHAYSVMQPIGVVGAITPWNMPLILAIAKIAPALAAGCTVVLKPSEETPLSILRVAELIAEAGIPDGVVNIVPGYGATAGAAISEHEDVDKIAFTGSTEVGKMIARAATGNLKKVALELGGKAPVVVFADADLDKAAQTAAEAIFLNSGQMCFAGSRLLVERSVMREVAEKVADIAKSMKLGPGLDETTDLGPLISAKQQARVGGFLEQARSDETIEILAGGHVVEGDGYFVEPTIAICSDPQATLVKEEIFGPVLCIQPFDTIEEAIELANDTPYGLVGSAWTKDVAKAHILAAEINAGVVWVNCYTALDESLPFGGFKQSGWGREGGKHGIEEFMEPKSVVVAL